MELTFQGGMCFCMIMEFLYYIPVFREYLMLRVKLPCFGGLLKIIVEKFSSFKAAFTVEIPIEQCR